MNRRSALGALAAFGFVFAAAPSHALFIPGLNLGPIDSAVDSAASAVSSGVNTLGNKITSGLSKLGSLATSGFGAVTDFAKDAWAYAKAGVFLAVDKLNSLLDFVWQYIKQQAPTWWKVLGKMPCDELFNMAFAAGGLHADGMGSKTCGREFMKGFICSMPNFITDVPKYAVQFARVAWENRRVCLPGAALGALGGPAGPLLGFMACGVGRWAIDQLPGVSRCISKVWDTVTGKSEADPEQSRLFKKAVYELGCNMMGSKALDLVIGLFTGGATLGKATAEMGDLGPKIVNLATKLAEFRSLAKYRLLLKATDYASNTCGGDSGPVMSTPPSQIEGLTEACVARPNRITGWTAVAGAPAAKSAAVTPDGILFAVGTNGQVHQGALEGTSFPALAGIKNVVAITSGGANRVCALKASGKLSCKLRESGGWQTLSGQPVAAGGIHYAAKTGSCSKKVGYGIVHMPARDCRAMGGAMNGNPSDAHWTDCHLDWCRDFGPDRYVASGVGQCAPKVGYGIVGMTARDCRAVGGGMNGSPADGAWISCHLDWCRAERGGGGLVAGRPGACDKLAYGHVTMAARDCRAMGGSMNGAPADGTWTQCHLDWCARPSGGGVSPLGVAADGTIWRKGTPAQRWSGSSWTPMPGHLKQISVGSQHHVWGIGTDGKPYRWVGDDWQLVATPPNANGRAALDGASRREPSAGCFGSFRRIQNLLSMPRLQLSQVSVGGDGTVVGIDIGGTAWLYDGCDWKNLNRKLDSVYVANIDNIVGLHGTTVYRATLAPLPPGKPRMTTAGYYAAKVGSCSQKVGYGPVSMMARDCRAMGGVMNGSPADATWADCHFDWCSDPGPNRYVSAGGGQCAANTKVGYGVVGMTAGDCRSLGGAMNGSPGSDEWTACHLDWCRAQTGGLVPTRGGVCARAAYGHVNLKAGECRAMGGGMNGSPAAHEWVQCHFDWCAKAGVTASPAGVPETPAQSAVPSPSVASAAPAPTSQPGWRWCSKCQLLHTGASPQGCPVGGAHNGSGGRYSVNLDAAGEGQPGWHWCRKCGGLVYKATSAHQWCGGGGTHALHSDAYRVRVGAPPAGSQGNWRWCGRCSALFYGGLDDGRCPATGGKHSKVGSGDYHLNVH